MTSRLEVRACTFLGACVNSLDQLARGYTVNSVRARFLGMGVRVHTTPGVRVISLSERRRVRERRRACDYLAVSLSHKKKQQLRMTYDSNKNIIVMLIVTLPNIAANGHVRTFYPTRSTPDGSVDTVVKLSIAKNKQDMEVN